MPNPNMIVGGYIPYPKVLRSQWYVWDRAGEATTVYPGDLVRLKANGRTGWIKAAAGSLLGVVMVGSEVRDGRPRILVADDPDQEYIANDDGDTTAASLIHIGSGLDTTNVAGDATLARSKMRIDISTTSIGVAGKTFKYLGQVPFTNQTSNYGSFTTARVRIANHQFRNPEGI